MCENLFVVISSSQGKNTGKFNFGVGTGVGVGMNLSGDGGLETD